MTRPHRLPSFARFALAVAAVLAPVATHGTGMFYEEPLTSLPDFLKLDQLPSKTFQTILDETAPETEDKAEDFDVDKELAALEGKPGRDVIAQIDKLVIRARAKGDTPALRVLNDWRDLHAGPATAAETTDYIAWRGSRLEFTAAELAERLKKASPAMRPHYLVLEGARVFAEGNDTDCQPFFEEVLKNSPKHPRAEVALFMLGRTQISRSRTASYSRSDRELNPAQRPRAKKLLDEYLAKYPKGRWAGDALGWLGAWYYDGNEFSDALRCYLGQLAMTDHPELAGSALTMCDWTISHLASAARDKSWTEVAKHPEAAQALVYLLLNSAESDNFNNKLDTADEVRAWRKKVLPQVAAAIAAQEKLYKGATWRPRYLATLALAASGNGQQDQALKLLATIEPGTENDDVLLARGVTLQRARRSQEAIAVFQQLLEKFPDSPLARGARLRLALAQADNHEAGQAILTLDTFLEKQEGEPEPDPSDRGEDEGGFYATRFDVPVTQVGQLIDLWLNFAPIEELAAPAKAEGFDPVKRLRFTEAIAQRLLAKEQFDEAKKYLTPAQFGLVAGPIEKLTIAAREAKDPAARATAYLALGDAWAAARGQLLTYPLDTEKTRKDVYPAEDAKANVRRADAAAILGYTGNFRIDLENRDELRHAFNWWIEASDQQPGTATTATALWRALRAMPLVADVSQFTYERALSRKWGDVSRKLYDRLRTECADSVEAKRLAAYWNFPPPKKSEPDDEEYFPGRDAAGAGLRIEDVFEFSHGDGDDDDERKSLESDLKELIAAAKTEKPQALEARMDKEAASARAKFVGLYTARWVNFYEDLALFFSEPDPGPEVRASYVELRGNFLQNSAIGGAYEAPAGADDDRLRKVVDEELADPATKPVADYFEFVKLAITANEFTQVNAKPKKAEPKPAEPKPDQPKTDQAKSDEPKEEEPDFSEKGTGYDYRSRDYPLLEKETKAFLDKYPKSKKREAALLLYARATYRASEDVTLSNYQTWPQAPRWEGGYALTIHSQEPFDAKKVQAALDAYDTAFPKGRYAADVRSYRADLALRLHNWKLAIDLTVAQFHNADREDLQEAAANRLDKIFTELANEDHRADLLPVIRSNPKAKDLLLKYLAHDSDVHPLRYLTTYLRDQLGASQGATPPGKKK